MYVTDITSLGTDYTIADMAGKVIGAVQVIYFQELLDATPGPYTESMGSFSTYLEQCVAGLTGFDDIEPNHILWHTTTDENFDLSKVIEYAVKNDFYYIIIEHIEELID